MRTSDQLVAHYQGEVDEKQKFIDSLVEDAEKTGRDLTGQELEMITRARDRITELSKPIDTMLEASRVAHDSRERMQAFQDYIKPTSERPREVEYRSAGHYLCDYIQSRVGSDAARDRLELYHRAAAHQTTADNPGLLPAPILGPVINFIDASRPLVGALGPKQIPSNAFSRPRVTQHTAVAAQSAEKAELTSQKMIIGKVPITPVTLGGYVNVSRQDLDWTSPGIMDIVVGDLAAQYAILTEKTAVQAFYTGATAGGTIPATPSGDVVAGQLWAAAASVYTATKGQGRLIAVASPDVLGLIGPLFAPVNPTNAQSSGFNASDFGQGLVGSVGGIPIYVSSGFAAAKSLLVLSTAAAEVYEDRLGSLSVVEPSVLGVQVAYAGYFAQVIIEATGIIKVTVT